MPQVECTKLQKGLSIDDLVTVLTYEEMTQSTQLVTTVFTAHTDLACDALAGYFVV